MDKQNEGIKDPEVKETPYDMGGQATEGVGERKAEHNRIRRRLDDVAGQNGSLVMYNMKQAGTLGSFI